MRLTADEIYTIMEKSKDNWGTRYTFMRLAADAATEKAVLGILKLLDESLHSKKQSKGIRLAIELIEPLILSDEAPNDHDSDSHSDGDHAA